MTDSLTAPVPIIPLKPVVPATPPTTLLTTLGDPGAAACEGDFCEIPEHHTQAVVNRRLDDDAV